MEELKMKGEQKQKESDMENTTAVPDVMAEAKETRSQSKISTSSNAEHDLDEFLLGDLGNDDGPDDGDDGFDDDFDKIGSNTGLDSDNDDEKKSKAFK